MSNEGYISIFLRTSINDTGLHYVPGPTLEARHNSNLTLNLALRRMIDKKPIVLDNKSVVFYVRKRKYPDSQNDILFGDSRSVFGDAYLEFNILARFLDIPSGRYWYDISVQDSSFWLEGPIIRPPLGEFWVTK